MRDRIALGAFASSFLTCFMGFLTAASAQLLSGQATVPERAFYVGVGGGFSSVDFGTQHVYAIGTSNVFKNGSLIASGIAAGPANIYVGSDLTFAPSAQVGYWQHLANRDVLWGAKLIYNYIGTTGRVPNAVIPQVGSFTSAGSTTPVPFAGPAVVQSYQTDIEHELAFIPMVGRSFDRTFLYVGAGPTLSRTGTNLNGLVGFADVNGKLTDVSGAPTNFSASAWTFGGTAAVGATYFLNASWFVDFMYRYAVTGSQTDHYSSSFVNTNGPNGSISAGTLVGTSSGKVMTQGVMITINRVF